MFGRDTLTNLKHLIDPKLRYMGTEELILHLEIMSNIYQAQIHNLKMARQHTIEEQKAVPDPKISTGDLVLVRDHTSKSFMPKYQMDYHVIRVLANKVEVKDNNDAFGCKGRLNFDSERIKDLGWTPEDQDFIFDPSNVSHVPEKETSTAVKQRSHPMQLRSAKIQEISLNEISIGSLLQNNSVIQWLSH